MIGAEVVVVGAGPAGCVAALVLARAGVRVRVLEREQWPRRKLCGDTVNPGAVASLRDLGLAGGPLEHAQPLTGMIVTSPRVSIRGTYPNGQVALAVSRDRFDAWLADKAVAAGAELACGVRVRGPWWCDGGDGSQVVAGVQVRRSDGRSCRMPAALTIAADGQRSVLARMSRLSRHPRSAQRWAFGMYATGVHGMSDAGEMHVRPGYYVGLAPLGGGLTNVCVVAGRRPEGGSVEDVIRRALRRDRCLRERTAGMHVAGVQRAAGPLAVDCATAGLPGLLLAGDAAGFVDPMTGDGVHLAIRGGVLAATVALDALQSGDVCGAASNLARRRAAVLGPKLRFNRLLRRLVGSPVAIEAAGLGARMAPILVKQLVRYAGDVA